jgi:hypothetical protein
MNQEEQGPAARHGQPGLEPYDDRIYVRTFRDTASCANHGIALASAVGVCYFPGRFHVP